MSYVELDTSIPIWERFLWVAPLVVIGTVEEDGTVDLAPKHMVTPLGWDNYFGFVCTPRHATYRNAIREGSFTVSYPRPDQLVHASLAAAPRCDDGRKASLSGLPVVAAQRVPGPLLAGAYLQLECTLDRVVEGFGENGLVVGKIVAARVHRSAERARELEDERLVEESPLLVYLAPGQFARVAESHSFPLPSGFRR
jgi:flavin reductase (DIM6/NTAB) family NADH-FMN oxidoreductase RutF